MSSKADFFLKKTLGDDFFESLQKFELWKPGTRTTVDHEEIKTALHIVPRTIMALLIRELTSMQIDDNKEINLPVGHGEAKLNVTKHERDVYTGNVVQDNKIIVDFKYRSIPGIGLVIMSAFELYNVDELEASPAAPDITAQVQKIIEERLALHDLVNRVVEKKLMEKDAIQQLLLARISDTIHKEKEDKLEFVHTHSENLSGKNLDNMSKSDKEKKKVSPLGNFLDTTKKKKSKSSEFSIQLTKSEQVNCPDCGGSIFNGQVISGCICVGDDMEKKVYLKKTEDGIKVRFSSGWDQENIEMLLEILRKKNG